MGLRVFSPNMHWEPMPEELAEAQAALARTLNEWRDTPYGSGQRFKQLGADCVGGVFGVVDELDGRARAQYPGMPQDASMHSRETAVAAVRELVRRYSPCEKVPLDVDGSFHVQPGDILVTGSPGGGPGHVEIVGGRNELWHCLPGPGFHQGGWSLLDGQILYAVYRINDKDRWR